MWAININKTVYIHTGTCKQENSRVQNEIKSHLEVRPESNSLALIKRESSA